MKNKGITLVALVVTIIIMLILAGVTLNLTLGDNGLFTLAKKSTEAYQLASEKEYLEQDVLSYQMNDFIGMNKTNLGIQLHNKTSINDNKWNIIQLLNDTKQIYGDSYYYIPKAKKIGDWGNANYNWIINYETGEIINIGEEKRDYVHLSFDSGISVTDNIILNINPINMSDESSWGQGVEFCNSNKSGSDVSGFNGTEIKFDGVDDYLKLENVKINKMEGFTFEFYGKTYDETNLYPLEKTVTNINDERYDKIYPSCFRTSLNIGDFSCCFSGLDSKSNKKMDDTNNKHWIVFSELKKDSNYDYVSMTVNYDTDTVTIFSKGNEVAKATCDHNYLLGESLLDSTIPFTIGLYVGGYTPTQVYSKFDLYACRFYGRVLSNDEIKENFNETISYHNYLVQ